MYTEHRYHNEITELEADVNGVFITQLSLPVVTIANTNRIRVFTDRS